MTDASESIDLAELERLAMAATPGPWVTAEVAQVRDSHLQVEPAQGFRSICDITDWNLANAEFIAATDPGTLLALLARLRDAEALIDELEEDLSICVGNGGLG